MTQKSHPAATDQDDSGQSYDVSYQHITWCLDVGKECMPCVRVTRVIVKM
jgi:hypothetical protein